MQQHSREQGPPKNYTRKQGPSEKTARGQSLPDDTVFVPPISMFLLGGGGILEFAILFLVFRIERDWKNSKSRSSSGVDAARSTAVEIVQHIPLVLFWGVLGFIADTVGDYTFLNIYTDNWFLLFMYGCALYASTTIMFARSIEYLWAGFVALEKWKAFQARLREQAGHKEKEQPHASS